MNCVVLDTNIYVSAFLFGGKPLEILRRIERREVVLAYSQAIRSEIEEVLALKFHWPAELIDLACTPIWGRLVLAWSPK